MTVFWILAVGLVGVALLFVLTPLLRPAAPKSAVDPQRLNRTLFEQQLTELDADLAAGSLDPARYSAARHDLERQLLYNLDQGPDAPQQPARSGRWAALVLGVAVPVVAIGLYRVLGNVEIISQLERPAAQAGAAGADHARGDLPSMEVLVQRLADKLAQNPDNLEGWMMLGRSYAATGQTEQSLAAYRRAYELAPRQPEVLLSYAETLAIQNDNQLAGEPERLIAAALTAAPQNPNALWLAGVAAFQRGDLEGAVRHWEVLEALLPPDGEDAANLRGFLAQARGETQPTPKASAPATPSQPAKAAASPGVALRVEVSLAEPLQARADPDDTLFVYARALQGPPMPLAVQRARVRDLPLTVTLDDSQALGPEHKLSQFPQVSVGARISPSGNASPRPGDLEGEVSPVTPGTTEAVRVSIDRVRP